MWIREKKLPKQLNFLGGPTLQTLAVFPLAATSAHTTTPRRLEERCIFFYLSLEDLEFVFIQDPMQAQMILDSDLISWGV